MYGVRILAGKFLDILEGKESPTDSHFPEDWIASIIQTNMIGREDYPEEGLSRVIIEGDSFLLRDIIEQYPAQILGDAHYKINGVKLNFYLNFWILPFDYPFNVIRPENLQKNI